MTTRTLIAIETALLLILTMRPVDAQECVGDCDRDGTVEINELVLGVNIALGMQPIDACPVFDCEDTGTAPVSCLIRGVNNSLSGCRAEVMSDRGRHLYAHPAFRRNGSGRYAGDTVPRWGHHRPRCPTRQPTGLLSRHSGAVPGRIQQSSVLHSRHWIHSPAGTTRMRRRSRRVEGRRRLHDLRAR